MSKTVVGLFDDQNQAHNVIQALEDAGFASQDIWIGAPQGDDIRTELHDQGVPDQDAQFYAEGVQRGGAVVSVRSPDDRVDTAVDIMTRNGAVDMQQRLAEWRQSGWTGYREESAETTRERDRYATGVTGGTASSRTMTDEGELRVPEVEERVDIGKRQVERGGVRVETNVIEQPVEKQVNLRDETVTVERRPADRPASEADWGAFKEGTLEVRETDEVPVIQKEARVTGEVVVGKDVQQRSETVRDVARQTNVDVQKMGGEQTAAQSVGTRDYSTYETDFRNNWKENYGTGRLTYNEYAPAYRYGYDLANDPRYQGQDWSAVESQARADWERNHQGSAWEDFKDSIRYAWDKVRGQA